MSCKPKSIPSKITKQMCKEILPNHLAVYCGFSKALHDSLTSVPFKPMVNGKAPTDYNGSRIRPALSAFENPALKG